MSKFGQKLRETTGAILSQWGESSVSWDLTSENSWESGIMGNGI